MERFLGFVDRKRMERDDELKKSDEKRKELPNDFNSGFVYGLKPKPESIQAKIDANFRKLNVSDDLDAEEKEKSVEEEELKRGKEEKEKLVKEELKKRDEKRTCFVRSHEPNSDSINQLIRAKNDALFHGLDAEEKEKLVKEREEKKMELLKACYPSFVFGCEPKLEPISQETQAKIDANFRKLNDSDCFDADLMDGIPYYDLHLMHPTMLSNRMEDLLFCSNAAIHTYNTCHDMNLEVVKVVKVVYRRTGAFKEYNITFTAKSKDSDSDSAPTLFQARVHPPAEVKLVRPAPQTSS